MHLVTGGHFWSHDKDDGHIVRSAIVKNPMLQANFKALCFTEPELLPMKVFHCGIGRYIYQMCKYELPTSRLSKVIIWQTQTYRQTDRHDQNYIPRHFVGCQQINKEMMDDGSDEDNELANVQSGLKVKLNSRWAKWITKVIPETEWCVSKWTICGFQTEAG